MFHAHCLVSTLSLILSPTWSVGHRTSHSTLTYLSDSTLLHASWLKVYPKYFFHDLSYVPWVISHILGMDLETIPPTISIKMKGSLSCSPQYFSQLWLFSFDRKIHQQIGDHIGDDSFSRNLRPCFQILLKN